MSKQLTEKEGMLKLIMLRYMDERVNETTAIKENFKIDYESLEGVREKIGEAKYQDNLK